MRPYLRGRTIARNNLRWGISIVLVVNGTLPVTGAPIATDSGANPSVLELQRLVNVVLLSTAADAGNQPRNSVLDIQRVLLDAVAPDPEPTTSPPAHQDEATFPVTTRDPVLPVLYLARPQAWWPPQPAAALLAHALDHPPPADATQRRYQFYLLSNAPPASVRTQQSSQV